jgi:membrane associated rhomboid family serine protease
VVIPIHDDNPTERTAIVTIVIIAICVVVFAFVQPRGARDEYLFTLEHAAIPCELQQDHPIGIEEVNRGECADLTVDSEIYPHKNIWRAGVFSIFLHASWLHLLGNMLFLWIFGNNVEDYLGKIGFAVFYVFAGIVALGAHVLADTGSTTPVIGASGAIAGVMGMYLVLWPRARVVSLVPILLFFPLAIPAAVVLLLWFGLQFLTDPNSGVAWVAHVAGFLLGIGVGALLRTVKPPRAVGATAR